MGMGVANTDGFNTQPPEGGWVCNFSVATSESWVSTHSRPKAAGPERDDANKRISVSTHSRPKAAGPERLKTMAVSL